MAELPYFPFYPADYLRDTEILSLSAQGGWMRMLCSMWHPSRRGVLCLRLPAVARLLGANEQATKSIIDEIEDCGVADVQWEGDRVTITSRRMARDWQHLADLKQAAIDAGKAGAAKRWGKNRGGDNPPGNGEGNSPPIPPPNTKPEGRNTRERDTRKAPEEKPPPAGPDPLFERLRAVHPKFSAPVLDPRERKAFADNRYVLASFDDETWSAIRAYYVATLPEGSNPWRPDQRWKFIESANDIAGRAIAWKAKLDGNAPAGTGIPPEFIAWATASYPSLNPRTMWLSSTYRQEWEAIDDEQDNAA